MSATASPKHVGALKIVPTSEREITITRSFAAPRTLVFDAHIKPELVREWLLGPPGWTMPVCEIAPKPGGAIRYVWRGPGGKEMGLRGVFREIVRPERIVHTEIFDEDWTGGETLVTSLFAESAGVTNLTMTVLYSSEAARDGALRSGMADGMEAGYARLDAVLASPSGRT